MSNETLTPEAEAAIDKIGKLLTLARDKRGNEAEAQAAMDAALRLLEKHNLDMALVERSAGKGAHAKRDDKSSGGGLYKWQRTLWDSVARLNMCRYFSIRGLERGSKYENRLVGRQENVLAATLMAEYLQDTVERIAAQWAKDEGFHSRFVREAIIFREGMADRLSDRIWDLRYQREQEARAAKAEAFKAAGGQNALVVITDVIQDEADLNADYLAGLEPGTHKKWRLEREAQRLAERAEAEARERAHQARLLIDPAYARQCEEERLLAIAEQNKQAKRQRTSSRSYYTRETAEDRRRAHYAFGEGRQRANDVGLDRQVDKANQGRLK